MQISEHMNAKLNEQINAEQYSAHLYLAFSAALETMTLRGFAKYYMMQAEEETKHALKIFDYVVDQGGKVAIKAISEPAGKWGSVEKIVEAARDHEIKVTRMIGDLVALAEKEKDYATRSFLQWFVDEQVEEVKSQEELLAYVKMAGPAQLLPLDFKVVSLRGE